MTNWLHSGEMIALGWTLLHFCWQSTIIALLYAIVDRCLVHATAAVRYVLAMGMLALMPIVALATWVSQEQLIVPVPQGGHAIAVSHDGTLHATVAASVPFAAPAVANSELWIAGHTAALMPWVDGIWLAGVLLLALRAAGGWWYLRSLRKAAQLPLPEAVQRSFQQVAAQLRLVQPVVLRLSREVVSPMAMGIWWTTIILPLSVVTSLPADQLEAVLAHELAHIRRWDYFCNLLQTAVECLFFFHPVVWWMSKRARDLREVCCDEIAARTCADPGIYAEALLRMEEQRAGHLQLAVAFHGSGGTLLNRIRRVMGDKTMEQGSINVVRVAAAGLVFAGLAVAPHVQKTLRAEPLPAQTNPTTTVMSPTGALVATTPHQHLNLRVSSPVSPTVAVAAAAAPAPVALPMPHPALADGQAEPGEHAGGSDYLQKMRDAGYPLDLNKDLDEIISLRSVGVTPEYARAMASTGLGTPSLHDLISLRAQSITPEYVAQMKAAGITPSDLHELVSLRAVGVTPEYAKEMQAIGYGAPTTHDLISMRAQGITPEYVSQMKAAGLAPSNLNELVSLRALGVTPEYAKAMAGTGYGTPTMHELISLKAQGITPEYVAQMKAGGLAADNLNELISMRAVGVTPEYAKGMADAGFKGLPAHDMVSLRAQGVTPEYVHWVKATFPNADLHEITQAAVFHIDQDFVSKAKAHSFNSTDLDKLVKLKMTGLLD